MGRRCQLRDARYLVARGRIASHHVFSYTAVGQPGTYPQLAGLARAASLGASGSLFDQLQEKIGRDPERR